jgi:hypothetical protein
MSPDATEWTVRIRRRLFLYTHMDRPLVLRVGSIAVWYDGERIRLAPAGCGF